MLSEGLHSFLDLISAAVSFFTVREAGKPADEDHPFGHGKIETLSSLFESLLLVLAAALIIYEGGMHLWHPRPIHHEGIAIAVISVSILMSYWTYRQNQMAARETESSAIYVNALHFLSDVVASLGVLLGLVLLKWTGWLILDSLIAFVVAAYILALSLRQVKCAILELSDTQLPDNEILQIRELLDSVEGMKINAHELRTRKSGVTRHIDFHLVVCGQMTVEDSHSLCDQIESKIMDVFQHASVNIHVEPCEKEKTHCHLNCPVKMSKN